MRGSIEPADYKRYVLPVIFLRFLSMRYEKRREELEKMVAEPQSEYDHMEMILKDPDEDRKVGAFVAPEEARWENIRKHANADDIKVQLENILELLEKTYPEQFNGLLPRIYAMRDAVHWSLEKGNLLLVFLHYRVCIFFHW